MQYVDSRNELDVGRQVFNSFLNRYPYCYGYWKKFADFEKRNGTPERVFEVFEEGVKSIPLSVDLWIHYINHVKVGNEEIFSFGLTNQQEPYVIAYFDGTI